VQVGGINAEVLYAGAAPGLVSGVFQLNVRLPPSLRGGEHLVQTTIDGIRNGGAATVAVGSEGQ
jgi:uncharacterized protein (TIGR03437 family)